MSPRRRIARAPEVAARYLSSGIWKEKQHLRGCGRDDEAGTRRHALRSAERSAQFSVYYARMFGDPSSALPVEFAPVSQDDACLTLCALNRSGAVTPATLERCTSQLLHCGYDPDGHCADAFDEIACRAAHTLDADEACERLRSVAVKQYVARDDGPSSELDPTPVEDEIERAVSDQRRRGADGELPAVVLPTRMTHDGDTFTVRREVWIDSALEQVGPQLDPRYWANLSRFFELTQRHDRREPPGASGPWNGTLREVFVINWNRLQFAEFDVVLNLDYTVTGPIVRADYSLAYEKDDQILVDEGFVESEKVSGHPGWTHYTMEKTLKFASSLMNTMLPAVLSMWIESDAEHFTRPAS